MTQKTILRSDELSCPSCVPKIEKALGALPGVEKAEVKFSSGKIEIEHDPARASVEALIEAVRGPRPSERALSLPPCTLRGGILHVDEKEQVRWKG